MLLSFVYGLVGIVLLTAFCVIGAFLAPQEAYWFMTPYAKNILEESGIDRKFTHKSAVRLTVLIVITGGLFVWTIITVGRQGVTSGMNFWQLSLRFLILFWMVSIFDAVVLDWCLFTKTKLFGIWLRAQTGKEPKVWSVDPQWDGKEIHKLLLEIAASALLTWFFMKVMK